MAASTVDDMKNPHINTLVFIVSIPKVGEFSVISQLLLQNVEDLSQVLMPGDLHVVKLIFDLFTCVSTPRICFQMQEESDKSLLLSCFQVFAF